MAPLRGVPQSISRHECCTAGDLRTARDACDSDRQPWQHHRSLSSQPPQYISQRTLCDALHPHRRASLLLNSFHPPLSCSMSLDRPASWMCTSAGRVTARLLLSFLALSATTAASVDDGSIRHDNNGFDQTPLLPPSFVEPGVRDPSDAIHTFVSFLASIHNRETDQADTETHLPSRNPFTPWSA